MCTIIKHLINPFWPNKYEQKKQLLKRKENVMLKTSPPKKINGTLNACRQSYRNTERNLKNKIKIKP